MHIGFFSSIVTDGHPTSGYELANEAIVDGLRDLGHRVSVIGFRLPRQREAAQVHPLAVVNLENAEASRWQKAQWLGRSYMTGRPIAAAKLSAFSPTMLDNVNAKSGPFDVHVLNSWQMAAAYPSLLEKPFGYVSHNVEYATAAENRDSAKTFAMRVLYGREARLLRALETKLCSKAAWVWALSQADLDNLPGGVSQGSVLPLVTPLKNVSTRSREKTCDIGMIGTWTWQANTHGLRWFVDEVFPLLPEDMKITVAGSVPEDISKSIPTISFPGRVDSASDFLESARVVALVSRGGTGVQLKTIEAFQAGHACVATPSSLRGVDQLPANCRRAEDARTFASELVDLFNASQSGKLPIVDGSVFAKSQREALLASLNEGLTAICARAAID